MLFSGDGSSVRLHGRGHNAFTVPLFGLVRFHSKHLVDLAQALPSGISNNLCCRIEPSYYPVGILLAPFSSRTSHYRAVNRAAVHTTVYDHNHHPHVRPGKDHMYLGRRYHGVTRISGR